MKAGSVQAHDEGTYTGDIQWFDETKGFGFIVSRGEDVFVRHTGLPEGYVPQPEDIVSFEETVGKDGRIRATSVVPHWGDFSNAPINVALPKWPIDTAELYDWAYMPIQRSSPQSVLAAFNTGLVARFYEPIYTRRIIPYQAFIWSVSEVCVVICGHVRFNPAFSVAG